MRRDRIIGALLIIVCVLLWFVIIPLQVATPKEAKYPKFVTVWIGLSSLCLLLRTLRKSRLEPQVEPSEAGSPLILGIILTLLFLYVFSVNRLGVFIASFLFLVLSMRIQGVKDWRIHIIVPSALLFFIYVLIERFLKFPLPKGSFFE